MSDPTAEVTDALANTKINGGDENGHDQQQAPEELTLRALVSTKEAGIIIGKGGETIARLRDSFQIKAGVSKVVQGVQDRVLTVTGGVEGVVNAYAEIAKLLLQTPLTDPAHPNVANSSFTSIRLLISHALMGGIIGKAGARIKEIQDQSGARMIATKELLPQSTERIVEVQGPVEAVKKAVGDVAYACMEDHARSAGNVPYHPGAAGDQGVLAGGLGANTVSGPTGGIRRSSMGGSFGGMGAGAGGQAEYGNGGGGGSFGGVGAGGVRRASAAPQLGGDQRRRSEAPSDPSQRTQSISIPSDMVGCIIGRAGAKITEIRRLSGSRISIAKVPHDETGERMFTIVGTPEANEKALFLLYNQLESEKQRRVGQAGMDDVAEE